MLRLEVEEIPREERCFGVIFMAQVRASSSSSSFSFSRGEAQCSPCVSKCFEMGGASEAGVRPDSFPLSLPPRSMDFTNGETYHLAKKSYSGPYRVLFLKKPANSRVNGILGSLSSAAEPCIERERAPWGSSSSSSPSLFFQNALMACLLVQRASESEEERAACPPVVVVCKAVSFLSFSRCLLLLVRRARSLPRGLEKKP